MRLSPCCGVPLLGGDWCGSCGSAPVREEREFLPLRVGTTVDGRVVRKEDGEYELHALGLTARIGTQRPEST